jgi:ABC-type sulfate transport system permease subunit
LIDLPFSVSPVIAGMVFVLLFGAQEAAIPKTKLIGTEMPAVINVNRTADKVKGSATA